MRQHGLLRPRHSRRPGLVTRLYNKTNRRRANPFSDLFSNHTAASNRVILRSAATKNLCYLKSAKHVIPRRAAPWESQTSYSHQSSETHLAPLSGELAGRNARPEGFLTRPQPCHSDSPQAVPGAGPTTRQSRRLVGRRLLARSGWRRSRRRICPLYRRHV